MEAFCGDFQFARGLFLFIYTFHMPAFLYISGLFGKRTIQSERYPARKLLPFLLVCFFLNFFRSISLYLYNHNHHFHFENQNNISWFLMALFACYTIAWLLRKVDHRYVLLFSVLIALVAGYDTHIDGTFTIARIVTFFPFFYLGYLTPREKLERTLDQRRAKYWAGGILGLWLILCLTLTKYLYALRPICTGKNSYYAFPLGMQWYSWAIRLVYYAGALLMMMCFFTLIPKQNIKYISEYGARTLSVYFWHLPFVTFAVRAPFLQSPARRHLWFLILFGILYSALLAWIFSQKIFSVPLDYMMRPGKFTGTVENGDGAGPESGQAIPVKILDGLYDRWSESPEAQEKREQRRAERAGKRAARKNSFTEKSEKTKEDLSRKYDETRSSLSQKYDETKSSISRKYDETMSDLSEKWEAHEAEREEREELRAARRGDVDAPADEPDSSDRDIPISRAGH